MSLKEIEIKEIIDNNAMFLMMLGYSSSIIVHLQSIIEDYDCVTPEHVIDQIDWFKTAIENIVYKNIPAPRMP